MEPLNQMFEMLDRWRHLPAYQLERRADILFAIYLPGFLSHPPSHVAGIGRVVEAADLVSQTIKERLARCGGGHRRHANISTSARDCHHLPSAASDQTRRNRF
jgi:hypothetical protein